MTRSLLISAACAAVFGLVNAAAFQYLEWALRPSLLIIYVYMIALNAVFHAVVRPGDDPKKFVTSYLAFSGGRLFLSLFVILVFALLNKDYLKPFALTFLFLYFGFTALEIMRLWKQLKK